tara:strand:+ start:263 stop:772 length:510 start_codon:yes stop_codon:yes gene_type:complete
MADDAKVIMSVRVLPDEIQKHFTGCEATVTPATANEKWYYKTTLVTNVADTDLIAGNFIGASGGTATGSSPAAIATGDKVRFLFIKNTGTTDGSTSTTEAIVICFDGGTAAYNLADGIEIGPGESFFCKCPNTTVGNLHAVTVDTNMNDAGSAGDGNVQCIVAALIDDV